MSVIIVKLMDYTVEWNEYTYKMSSNNNNLRMSRAIGAQPRLVKASSWRLTLLGVGRLAISTHPCHLTHCFCVWPRGGILSLRHRDWLQNGDPGEGVVVRMANVSQSVATIVATHGGYGTHGLGARATPIVAIDEALPARRETGRVDSRCILGRTETSGISLPWPSPLR
ncbi:hypothetical protein NL676_012515 [Syzygium grande]|nr:hypothetical protein NL676_012515 [Syzygium grande]